MAKETNGKIYELDILNHPSSIYRVCFKQNELIIRRCDGEYSEILENSSHSDWKIVFDKAELFSVYEYIILNNVDFKFLFVHGDGTLDNNIYYT